MVSTSRVRACHVGTVAGSRTFAQMRVVPDIAESFHDLCHKASVLVTLELLLDDKHSSQSADIATGNP